MSWAATGAAGIGAAASIYGAKKGAQRAWSPYGPAKDGLNQSIDALAGLPMMEAYDGSYTADQNPMMIGALQSMYSNPMGNMFADQMMGEYGNDLASLGLEGYMDQLDTMQVNGPREFEYDNALFDQTMGNYMPGLESLVENNGRMTTRQMNSDLARLRAAGGLGGNTKVDQESALAQALAAENADKFATNAFNSAFGTANNNAMGAGQFNLNSANAYDQNMLNSYGSFMDAGFNNMITGNQQNTANINMQGLAGQVQQGYDQLAIDNSRMQHFDKQNIPRQDMMDRMAAFSGLGTGQQAQGINPFQFGAQGAQAGMALYSAFQPQNNAAGFSPVGQYNFSAFGNANQGNPYQFASQNQGAGGFFGNSF